jgi:hypothetical protein
VYRAADVSYVAPVSYPPHERCVEVSGARASWREERPYCHGPEDVQYYRYITICCAPRLDPAVSFLSRRSRWTWE